MKAQGKLAVLVGLVILPAACSTSSAPISDPDPTAMGTIQVDPTTTFQTMRGWEATAFALNNSPGFDNFIDRLLERVVNEVGINRVRLAVRSGAENDQDNWSRLQQGEITAERWREVRYATVNDNESPNSIDWSGFHFSELDDTVVRIVLPLKRLVETNGEALYVTLNYVAFTRQIKGGAYHHDDPAEYAEFMLAVFQYLDETFGLVPDGLEILLEPENVPQWNQEVMGEAIIAVTDRLSESGYVPQVIAPSTTKMANAPGFISQWAGAGGILGRVHTLSYHRYRGFSASDLANVAEVSAAHGLETAMLEWWDEGNSYLVLHEDLKTGMNSAWQHGVLGGSEGPMALYKIDDSNVPQPVLTINDRTKFTRQYFSHVRSGAIRIGASSSEGALDPLAFLNIDGGYVVVVKTDGATEFTIGGLPPGRYGTTYATASEWDVSQPDQTILAGQPLSVSIPAKGVVTIFSN